MANLQALKALEEPEGARRATGGSASAARAPAPDPEVEERPQRRKFTTEYKLRILREVDACKGEGDIGALLRREGLYSSHLSVWRRQRNELGRSGMANRNRGRNARPEDRRVKHLAREVVRLKRRLKRAEAIISIQKKASELLGIPLKSLDSEDSD